MVPGKEMLPTVVSDSGVHHQDKLPARAVPFAFATEEY